MSNNESFIEEVSEEVRRDRLYAMMRRYGWIAILIVVLLVGGAAWNEWRKSNERAEAQQVGDAILSALQLEDSAARAEALGKIEASGDRGVLLSLMQAGETAAAEDTEAARATLEGLAAQGDLPRVYRDLASLKLILMDSDLAPADRRAALEPLAIAGAPYRLLAEEQLALVDVAEDKSEAAIDRLNAILQDTDVSAGLRQRASQLIVALGGTPEAL